MANVCWNEEPNESEPRILHKSCDERTEEAWYPLQTCINHLYHDLKRIELDRTKERRDRKRLNRKRLNRKRLEREAALKGEWDSLVLLEPQLEALAKEVQAIKVDPAKAFCANRAWRPFRAEVIRLVGWSARTPNAAANPTLKTSDAYDVAYQTLYNLLPDCRDCACYVSPLFEDTP